jgi:hypothetical protein
VLPLGRVERRNSVYKDKDGNNITIGTDICIENYGTPCKVQSYTSTGIQIGTLNSVQMDVLKDEHQKEANRKGFIPLNYFKSEKIKICTREEYPECYV